MCDRVPRFFVRGILQYKTMHIGRHIRYVLKSQGRSISWFARNLNTVRGNVYDIFNREFIDTNLLSKISLLLEYNFFEDLATEIENELTKKKSK